MHFEREGIAQLCEAVDAKRIDAVVVKDLSRLGRHRTQTVLCIDYLRKNHVRRLEQEIDDILMEMIHNGG